MKSVLIIGLGSFGEQIAMQLNAMKQEAMGVDIDEDRVNAVLPLLTDGQIGDATNAEFLKTLGVRNYDVCIVSIGENFLNSLQATYLLHELGAKMVVARASSDVQENFLLRNGADHVVYPEKQMAKWTAVRYTSDHILDYIEMDEDHAILEVSVPDDWIDHSVGELDIRKKYGISIMAYKTEGHMHMTILPDTILTADMTLMVFGETRKLYKYFDV